MRVSIRVMALPEDTEVVVRRLQEVLDVVSVRGPYRNRDPKDRQVRHYIEADVKE